MATRLSSLTRLRAFLPPLHANTRRAHERCVSIQALTVDHADYDVQLASDSEEVSRKGLYHRSVEFALRAGPKRETKELRKDGVWIPSVLQGRGKFPDLLIRVPLAPFLRDFEERLFAVARHGRVKWSGPLYELRPSAEAEMEYGEVCRSGDMKPWQRVPFQRIRVKAVNMELVGPVEVPRSIGFVFCPEEEPVRVRIPVKCINMEKCGGLKDGGFLNRLQSDVDVNVAAWVKAPQVAYVDVAGLGIKGKRTVRDLIFEGKDEGCRAVLDDDVVVTMISKV